jgi:hypothetical protein
MPGPLGFPRPASLRLLALLLPTAPDALAAQTPVIRTAPSLPTPAILPAGPTISDWQPRGRAVTGGTIVLMGSNFRVADLRAVIGPSKYPLPVRTATSTPSRIELAVPEEALGKLGELVVGYPDTRGTVVEAAYRIDPPTPALIESTAQAPLVPFLVRSLTFVVREFPGVRVNIDDIQFGSGTCGFAKRRATVFGSATRQPDLTIRVTVQGHFRQTGTCTLPLTMRALNDAGAYVGTVPLTATFSVSQPTTYTFGNTSAASSVMAPRVVSSGLGSICQADRGDWPGGEAVGVHTVGGDMAFIVRANVTDVKCAFRTDAWLLPPGVRLSEIRFSTAESGNRCGGEGSTTDTYVQMWMPFRRGAVNPLSNPSSPDAFTASGDESITFDGVTLASGLFEPRQVVLPLYVGLVCGSTLTLGSVTNLDPGVTRPHSFTVRVDRIVFTGPPGLALSDIARE